MNIKVAKFGGTSLASSDQFKKVYSIVKSDAQRRYIVPSAFGKRNIEDKKITDLLYCCYERIQNKISFHDIFDIIKKRCLDMVDELNLSINLNSYLETIKQNMEDEDVSRDYIASRGEYISGIILAELLGYKFIDAADVILFDKKEKLDMKATQIALGNAISKYKNAVIPGFYGSMQDGKIKTFSRGGSDITGAIVARIANASVYENWTDVSGLLITDPKIVANPKPVERVTYKELRELSYMGALVIHDEAVEPVREAKIPINIRNTNEPDNPGTIIEGNVYKKSLENITGIAGRNDFTVISIGKNFMDSKIGFISKILSILESNNLHFERLPLGIDNISIVISKESLNNNLEVVIEEIKEHCNPDFIDVYDDISIIATVGQGIVYTPGIASRILSSLYNAGINVRLIDQGSSEINIIIGVKNRDFQKAIQAIYDEFVS